MSGDPADGKHGAAAGVLLSTRMERLGCHRIKAEDLIGYDGGL